MRIPAKPKKQYKAKQAKVKGYLRIGSLYVSLVFLASALIAVFAFGVLYMTAFHPVAVALWYERQNMPEFSIYSPYLAGYEGEARLLLPDGSLLYEGDVGGAVISGNGKLYQDGFLLYDGGFAENLYNGRGTLYAQDGSVLYTGDFSENLPHGSGTLYFKLGKESYSYTGSFEAGARSGEGTLSKGNALTYEGSFKDNMRDGFGREYANGKLRYEGLFLRDAYEGEGKLFDNNGRLIYEGGFSSGKYSGDGTEYDPHSGYPVFQGKYLDGGRMEAGTEYDAHGEPITDVPAVSPAPLDLLDSTYEEALSALSKTQSSCREQAIDGRKLIIDEAGGAIYAFSLNEAGKAEALSETYLCGLASAGNLVVGSQMDNTEKLPVDIPEIGAGEQFALSLSNSLWGHETLENELVSVTLESGDLIVTAFCEAVEDSLDSADELEDGLPDDKPAGGKVLPGDPPVAGFAKVLPGDPGTDGYEEEPAVNTVKAGRIVFLKVSRPVPDEQSVPTKE